MTELTKATRSQQLLQLSNKRILILGLGQTGLSCVRYLASHGIVFAVNDSRCSVIDKTQFNQDYPGCQLVLGSWDSKLIAAADIIIVSPGIDLFAANSSADNVGVIADNIRPDCQIWGDVELFCRLCDTPVIAVTGSNGKSTVVSLLAYLGQALGINAVLGGNVGVPVLDLIDKNPELLVLELSSFQLETITSMNSVASSLLNLSDDHLDRHLTMDNYRKIKQKVYQHSAMAVVNRDDEASSVASADYSGKVISFGSDKPDEGHFGFETVNGQLTLMFGRQALISAGELPLCGNHNALNCLAALALGCSAGWSLEQMVTKLPGFTGLEHRCQTVNSDDDILWINDSKATNVGATLAAISGLVQTKTPAQQLILIAGGDGKGADFTPLKLWFEKHVNLLVTLGADAEQLLALSHCGQQVKTMEQAVDVARAYAKPGDIVLLSPACSSLDMFKNFAERGQVFMAAVTASENTDSAKRVKL